ncbi:AMP-binding protein [Aerosakkonemataceae cyanobacterium BLCC-F50]|uniref:AMP-binding protein n=1 Tax=Floridaenema flaviceps BLCC-F50 TaxID=3153642 RepID=A0ABV4XSE3_9CYAN
MNFSNSAVQNYYYLTSTLLSHPLVVDCAVFPRRTACAQELIAYIVTSSSLSSEVLQNHIQSTLAGTTLPPISFVFVSRLPLTDDGALDEQKLLELEVIDSEVVEQFQASLQTIPDIEAIAVTVAERHQSIPPLHLSDVLPVWRSRTSNLLPTNLVNIPSTDRFSQSSSAMAIAQGEALLADSHLPKNLVQVLQKTVESHPDRGITYIHSNGTETVQSYCALLDEAQRILSGLRVLGLKPQDKIIFQLEPHQDFIPAFWACILGGFVPVPISQISNYDPDNGIVKKLINTWGMLKHPLVLTNAHHVPEFQNLTEQLKLDGFYLAKIEQLRENQPDRLHWDSNPQDLAVLLFTSGSTGTPKGVCLTHHNLVSNIVASVQRNHLTHNDISLNWLNLDHVGSLVRCSIRDIYAGSQQIHAPAAAFLENPLNWLDWIERYRVTFAWAPNFALGLINEQAETIQQRKWDLSCLRSIVSVAEPIVPKTAKRFFELLAPYRIKPEVMHAAWGMSETGAAVVFSHRYLLQLSEDSVFVEVGRPVPGFAVRIVDAQDQLLREGEIGRVQISGPMVITQYYNNPEINKEAFTADGWFKTGDLGLLQAGYLTITGREKDVIIINGLNHYSHEIEAVVDEVEGVVPSYTAACGIREADTNTDRLAIFFHPSVQDDASLIQLLQDIRHRIASKLGINPHYLLPVEKDAIPKSSIGKIQRSILRERLEANQFDDLLKRVDLLLHNENTIPDWFYQKVWRRKEAVTLNQNTISGLTLIFSDSLGLGDRLRTELEQQGQRCITIQVGSTFAQLSDASYQINPTNREHYKQVLQCAAQTEMPIAQIVHLWTYSPYTGEVSSLDALEQAQNFGTYSLLWLVQALSQVQTPDIAVRLQVVSSYSQPISTSEDLAYEKAPLLGLIKTLPQEMPWIDCRHLDLILDTLEVNAAQVLAELQVIQRDREVAYRHGQRYIPLLKKADIDPEQQQTIPFKQGGIYLISGGLGEIGVEIAQYLIQQYQAKLVLVGRTPLPPRERWAEHLGQNTKVARQILSYLHLEKLTSHVWYEAIDICDLTQLQSLIEHIESIWGAELQGVIHLARVTQEYLISEETQETWAAMLHPKVFGAWTLHQLIKNKPESIFIHFSSVSGWFGTYQLSAYAAANRFLDCFSHVQRYKNSLQSYCFAWSIWQELGNDRSYQMRELSKSRGYYTLSTEQGLNSLLIGLCYSQPYLMVGIDGSNPYMRSYTDGECQPLYELRTYYKAVSPGLDGYFSNIEIKDRFGVSISCHFEQVQKIPQNQSRQSSKSFVAPRNQIELQLTQIWEKVLGIQPIGIQDNFFDLGGTSLTALRMFGQIEAKFGKLLPLSTLFKRSTIELLAEIVEPETALQLESDDELERSPKQLLVKIQEGDPGKTPLFLVHALGVSVLYYRDFARYLGTDRPVYAIQPLELKDQSGIDTLEALAALYIKAIQVVQPQGPYLLGGHSFGGRVAFEMAQQLHHQGQDIAFLGLFDTFGPNAMTRLPFRKRILIHFHNFQKQGLSYLVDRIGAWYRYIGELVKNKYQRWIDSKVREQSESISYEIWKREIQDFHLDLSRRYSYRAYPGHIHLFRCVEYEPVNYYGLEFDKENLGWDKVAKGGLTICDVLGKHLMMFDEPYVQSLGEKVRTILSER